MQRLSAVPMSTKRMCLQERLPSSATRRVHPAQLREVAFPPGFSHGFVDAIELKQPSVAFSNLSFMTGPEIGGDA